MNKKILLSGVKPTGRIHIGNYFGAMKQMVDLQDKYESYIFIADYHAMTTVQNKAELTQGIIDVALNYLAIGLDPKKPNYPYEILFETNTAGEIFINDVYNIINLYYKIGYKLVYSHIIPSQCTDTLLRKI